MSILILQHFKAGSRIVGVAAAVVEAHALSEAAAVVMQLKRERLIDEELAQSFAVSDPPSWVKRTSPEPVRVVSAVRSRDCGVVDYVALHESCAR